MFFFFFFVFGFFFFFCGVVVFFVVGFVVLCGVVFGLFGGGFLGVVWVGLGSIFCVFFDFFDKRHLHFYLLDQKKKVTDERTGKRRATGR